MKFRWKDRKKQVPSHKSISLGIIFFSRFRKIFQSEPLILLLNSDNSKIDNPDIFSRKNKLVMNMNMCVLLDK